MKTENKIYSLTRENIINEYKYIFKKNIISFSIKFFAFVAYYFLITWLILQFPFYIFIRIITTVVIYASGVYILRYYIVNIVELLKNYNCILNNNFIITTEKVVNSFSKERHRKFLFLGLFFNPVLAFFIVEPKPYRLIFSGFGEYKVLDGQYYTYSDIYEMNDYGVFNRAAVGDTHYLVVCGKNIALAYNTKMFDYKENNLKNTWQMVDFVYNGYVNEVVR